ncbi:kinesin-like protein KIN-7O [Tanacetum coccineum]
MDKAKDEYAESSCDVVRVSVLNLVGLAGSKRAAKTCAEGVRLKEGSHINKSLMTLGTIIKKPSEGAETQGGHVPYQDNKLTRILQPALGGNANTAIISLDSATKRNLYINSCLRTLDRNSSLQAKQAYSHTLASNIICLIGRRGGLSAEATQSPSNTSVVKGFHPKIVFVFCFAVIVLLSTYVFNNVYSLQVPFHITKIQLSSS